MLPLGITYLLKSLENFMARLMDDRHNAVCFIKFTIGKEFSVVCHRSIGHIRTLLQGEKPLELNFEW